ncbi:MAG: methyltransferase domain-containing protein [Solirubrobacteraceae bacterium]
MTPKNALRAIDRHLPWGQLYRGDAKACPCCEGRFRAMRRFHGRPDARCPGCGALERHRSLWLFLRDEFGIERLRGRMLHVAPEVIFERKFAALPNLEYIRGDLAPQRPGIRRLDVTSIDFPDDTFDIIVINHVLEHVPDDRAAIAELRRTLRPTGVVIMQHPRDEALAETYEDSSIVTKADRRQHFGQVDHVRLYGRDFFDRLRAGGFDVETHRYADEVSPQDRDLFALAPLGSADPGNDIHLLS